MIRLGLLIAMSATIHTIESLLPPVFVIPGFRWGLSNAIVLFCVASGHYRDALLVGMMKSALGSFFSGTLFSVPFFLGFTGVITGSVAMILASKTKVFGLAGVSVAGAMVNNLTQMTLASLVVRSPLVYRLLPYVVILGTISAVVNAIIVMGGIRWMKKRQFSWFLYPSLREGKN